MISAAIKNRPDHQYNTLPPRVFSHHSCPCQIALGYRHRPESPTVPGCRWASRVSHTLLDWQPLGRALEPSITRAAALLRGGYSYPTKGRGGTVSVTGMGSFAVKGSDQRGGVPYPTKGRGGSFSTTSGTSGRLRGKRSARNSTANKSGSYAAARRSAPMPVTSSIAQAISPLKEIPKTAIRAKTTPPTRATNGSRSQPRIIGGRASSRSIYVTGRMGSTIAHAPWNQTTKKGQYDAEH